MANAADTFERGWQLHQARDFRQAEAIYRRLLAAEPHSARLWFVLGDLCESEGRLEEATACYRQAVELSPQEALGHLRLGNILLRQDKKAEAEPAYRRCLEIDPGQIEARVNLGFVLGELDRLDDARACYEEALRQRPDLPEAHHNLGNVLREQGKIDEALPHYHEALRLRPDYAKAHINLGVALVARGAVEEALRWLQEGVRLQPDSAESHSSLGTALCAQGRLDAALAEYELAIQLKPDYPDAHWNRALVRLLRGDLERGWPDYEWRWRCARHSPMPDFTQPRWDGGTLDGRTILLYAEQGLGDTLHFVRYAPLVRARGGRVIVQCQGALIPLLSRSRGIDGLVAWGDGPPPFDVYVPLMTLPSLFHTTLERIPADIPYLFADPDLIAHWRRELAPIRGLRVGIAWQGSPRHPWDRHRSVSLNAFEPLARIEGVQLISLQQGHGAEQLRDLGGRFRVLNLGELVDRTAGPFMDTAAILHNLDLVMSVDTAIAHLAGGLGVPLWLAIHHTPDWRWLLDRDDNPWYPSARLFRQPAPGDWASVFGHIAEELRRLVARRARPHTMPIEVSPGELLDRLASLEVGAPTRPTESECATLTALRAALPSSPELDDLAEQLQTAHEQRRRIEKAIRRCERDRDFGPRFTKLVRSARRIDGRRRALRRRIDQLFREVDGDKFLLG
jgi:tetratricopeptide (TPR) repeat protein